MGKKKIFDKIMFLDSEVVSTDRKNTIDILLHETVEGIQFNIGVSSKEFASTKLSDCLHFIIFLCIKIPQNDLISELRYVFASSTWFIGSLISPFSLSQADLNTNVSDDNQSVFYGVTSQ